MMANLAFTESNEKLLVEKIGNNCITFSKHGDCKQIMKQIYKLL